MSHNYKPPYETILTRPGTSVPPRRWRLGDPSRVPIVVLLPLLARFRGGRNNAREPRGTAEMCPRGEQGPPPHRTSAANGHTAFWISPGPETKPHPARAGAPVCPAIPRQGSSVAAEAPDARTVVEMRLARSHSARDDEGPGAAWDAVDDERQRQLGQERRR
ncbi:hypothetical protein LX36DRAFT_662086 [Colletotrichum falcatum]|nr:hypothetical protein LX36DRAFT_662086 [Colletotrichum falcatum]